MIGSTLTRFQTERRFLVFDTESEGLNLSSHRPWEISYLLATLKGPILRQNTWVVKYGLPQTMPLNMSEDAARISHFDQARYDREGRPAREVWADLGPLFADEEIYYVGHGILAFDHAMITTLRANVGLPADHSWTKRAYDTDCLSKAITKGWVPDLSSADSFLSFQYKAQAWRERGLKSRLGVTCHMMGVDYDEREAHSAGYDVDRNWLCFKEMVNRIEC